MKNLLDQGIAQKLVRLEDDKKYIVYVHQNKRRNFENPEEKVQAEAFLSLVLDYKYPPERVRQFVSVQMGADTREADIIVYDDALCLKPLIVVECKRSDVSELEYQRACDQCFSYAVAEGAKYVWTTSGLKDAYYEVPTDKPKARITVPDVPQFGVKKLAVYKYAYGGGTTAEGQKLKPIEVVAQDELTARFKQAHQALWGRIVDASFILNESASKLQRIDGNHRLSAAMSESVRRYRVPFCIVMFGNQDQASGFGRAVFHTINFKQRPMDMEHNLRLILDATDENLRLFPTDKLQSEPSFGRTYVRARLLLPKIDSDFFEGIHNALSTRVGGVSKECHRTFALAVAQLFDGDALEDATWVSKVFVALKHVNSIYAQHDSLKASVNRGLLAAFVFLSMESDAAARSKLKRFTDWVVRGHLATLTEIAPADLLGIFDKLQTAKNRQVFVAMAFRDETKPTFKAIQDAIADVNRDHHLGLLPIKPIRIDEFDTWRSYKITDAIMEQVEGSGLVIADLTYGNANVYHEIGYLFGLNTTQQRRLVDNLILIWHKTRAVQDHEKAGTQEAVDVRFDLKDWSALRFSEPNELRKSLAAALVEHYSPLNT